MRVKTHLLIVALSLLCVAPAFAGHGAGYDGGQWDWDRFYSQGKGGEFRLLDDGGPGALDLTAYVDGLTRNLGGETSFETFCLEVSEHIGVAAKAVLPHRGRVKLRESSRNNNRPD